MVNVSKWEILFAGLCIFEKKTSLSEYIIIEICLKCYVQSVLVFIYTEDSFNIQCTFHCKAHGIISIKMHGEFTE
jgi:hypothetical protein